MKKVHILQGGLVLASMGFMLSRCTSGGPSPDEGAVMPPELTPTPTTEPAPSSLATAPPTTEATPSPSPSPKVYKYPLIHNFARAGDLTDPATGKAASLKFHIETELARTLREKANVNQDIAPALAELLVNNLEITDEKVKNMLKDSSFPKDFYGIGVTIQEDIDSSAAKNHAYKLISFDLEVKDPNNGAVIQTVVLKSNRSFTLEDAKQRQQEKPQSMTPKTPAEFIAALRLTMQLERSA
jgi:hypothetical protein